VNVEFLTEKGKAQKVWVTHTCMVEIFIEREKKRKTIEFSGTIEELMAELGVNPETVVITRNGEVVTEKEKCSGDDKLQFLSVISGG
jgi:sulfur carrier protein ThiS